MIFTRRHFFFLNFLLGVLLTDGLRAEDDWVVVAHAISSGVEIPKAIREFGRETGKSYKILHVKKGHYPEDLADSFNPADFDRVMEFPEETPPEAIAEYLEGYSLKYSVLVGVEGILWPFEVNEILGLPTLSSEQARIFLNKDLFYKFLQEPKFKMAPHSVNFAEIKEWEKAVDEVERKNLHYPLVAKPSNDAASHGFEVIQSPEDLREYAKLWLSGGAKTLDGRLITKLVIQPFFVGEHYSVQVVVSEGNFVVSDVFLHKKSHKMYLESIFLSNKNSVATRLIDFLSPMILGINGTFALHIELVHDPRYGLVPYDCGPRCMGGKEYYLVKEMKRINQQKWLVMAVLNPELFKERSRTGVFGERENFFEHGVLVDWVQHEAGTVNGEPNLAWIESLPGFYKNFSHVTSGMEISRTESLVTSHGSTIFRGNISEVEDSVLKFREAERLGDLIRVTPANHAGECNSTFIN